MSETSFEKRFRVHAASLNLKAVKFIDPGMNGAPDRIILRHDGRVAFAELKKKGGVISNAQIEYRKLLRERGFEVVALWPDGQWEKWLRSIA